MKVLFANAACPKGYQPTHTSLRGGKFYIPQEWHWKLAYFLYQCFQQDTDPLLVERFNASDVCRLFVDIDLKNTGYTMAEAIVALPQYIKQLADEQADTALLDYQVHGDTTGKGVHVLWNTKHVSQSDARALVEQLKGSMPEGLAKTVDLSVYKSGLRMLGCVKGDEAHNRRCYLPSFSTWDAYYSGKRKQSTADWRCLTLQDIYDGMIRTGKEVEGTWKKADTQLKAQKLPKANKVGGGKTGTSCTHQDQQKWPQAVHDAFATLLQQYTSLGKHRGYAEAELMSLKTYKTRTGVFCVCATNSHWCAKKQDRHSQAKAYFVLQREPPGYKLYAKCHADKCNGFQADKVAVDEDAAFTLMQAEKQ